MSAGARAFVSVMLAAMLIEGLTPLRAHGDEASPDTTAATLPSESLTSDSMFPKGTRTMQFYGAYYHSIVDDEEIVNAVAALNYYFDERHAFRVEIVGYRNDVEGSSPDADDSVAGGVNVGLRYHFLEYQRFTMFFEGVAGMFYGSRNFPEGATHFNFNEQLGLGATFRLDEHAHLIAGARFMHISNARIRGEDENPGFDCLGGYFGLMFTY